MMDRQSITKEEVVDQLYQLGGRVLGKDIADVAAQAERVKSIFGKVGKLTGYVKDIVNTLSLLKDYASGAYTQVPWRIVAALTGSVFYVFNPLDLIPDIVPLFGFTDDATVFAAVLSFAKIDIASYLAWKADRGERIVGGGKSGNTTIQKSEDITNWSLTDFVEVVQKALASIGNTGLRWFYGEPYVSQNGTNIHEKIMGGNGSVSDIIGAIDMEAFQHCKEGFAFTRDRVYFRQFMGDSFSFAWREIVSIQYEGKELIINGMRLDNMCKDEKDANTVCKVLTAIANRADLTQEPEPYDESRYVSISEAIVKRFATVDGGGLLFTGNNIPQKKRMGAHKAMNIQEPSEDICLVFDNSLLGNGKSGFACTSKAFYVKNGFSAPARAEWGLYKCFANPNNFWFTGVPGHVPYYEVNGSTLSDQQISAIADGLNEFQMYNLKEVGRSTEAKCKSVLEQIDACEKLVDRVGNEGKDISAADEDTEDGVKPEAKQRSGSDKKATRTRKEKSLALDDSGNNNEKSSQLLVINGTKKGPSKKSSRLEKKTDAATALTSTTSKGRNGSKKNSSAKKKSEKSACDAPETSIQADTKAEDDVTNVKAKQPTTKTKPTVAERIPVGDAVRKSIADSNESNIYVGEAIPTKKLNNAIACMGVRVGEDVYALIDTTWFGSGKTGLIFTSIGIRWKNDWTTDTVKTMLQWSEVKEVLPKTTCEKYDLRFSDDAVVNLAGSSVEPKALKAILERIAALVG